ncbi:hypothetical protein LOK49_LG07G00601 [Camellia lanceoleosa]|uniref:Uncharacterized protein n=1 Tax=Camellia lanceoleosa TaxID=1840588 RepID=A0ACC0H2T5_9ERIC|nr:hypothetical protein LOK49_LG07G00601 [Camellia lanceoleosa]
MSRVYPEKMSSSSIGGGEGQMLRFMSKKCRCGRKAAIRIVESEKPSKEKMRLMMRSQELRKVCSLMED